VSVKLLSFLSKTLGLPTGLRCFLGLPTGFLGFLGLPLCLICSMNINDNFVIYILNERG